MTHDHHHDHDHSELSGNAVARARAGNRAHREGLRRSGGARSADRDLREEGRPAQRRPRRRQSLGRSGLSRAALQGCDAGHRRARLCRTPGRAHRGAGEYAEAAQHGRVHAVLLLPVAGARPAAGLVQVGALPLARRQRSARRARRFRLHAAPRTPKSACGIRPPRFVISSSRCAPPAPKAGARRNSPNWSRAIP